ncbi:MAG: hypothetical protein DRQ88_03475 [Epsilonproteobacteria bacterium]|nr:MAG: hypothetical protein DRQ88_03475 [Campylobacterota bacterium]
MGVVDLNGRVIMKNLFIVSIFLFAGSAFGSFLDYCNGDLSVEEKVTLAYIKIETRAFSCEELNEKRANLKVLEVNNTKEIKDISVFKYFRELEILDLSQNKFIEDLTPLSDLINLKKLYLAGNKIKDVAPLKDLVNLRVLDLSINKIRKFGSLRNLSNLITFKLNWNMLNDISPLADMTSIEVIFLKGNIIGKISVLSGLTKLRKVHVFFNAIGDLSPLAELQNLDTLTAEYNPVRKNEKDCPVAEGVPLVLSKFCKEYLAKD